MNLDDGKPIAPPPEDAANGAAQRTPDPALADLAFPGCVPEPMTAARHAYFGEYRIEFWDAKSRTAWVLRDGPSPEHEIPISRLADMVSLIAAVRGRHVKTVGSPGLLRSHQGRLGYVPHPDLVIFLEPGRSEVSPGHGFEVDDGLFPSVILEVDHTTDVRRGKLKVYEAWGIPELWVDVPEAYSPSRPSGLEPGLTIRLFENGAYRVSPVSRAFPDWRADEIHRCMNEYHPSPETYAILERMGRKLGREIGTSPDDNPLMRSLRDETRAEGRLAATCAMVGEMLRTRGIPVSDGFPGDVPGLADLPETALVDAAMHCTDESDFRARFAAASR